MGLNMEISWLYSCYCTWQVWNFFLGASLGSLYGLEFGCTKGTELCLSNGRVLCKTLDTYDGT